MTTDGDTKERLLAAAREVYLEGGVRAFSLREVARRVGVSAAAVYRHYPSKEALLDAVCARGFEAFAGYLVRALGETAPLSRLRATGRMYLAFALAHPQDYRVIFLGDIDRKGAPPQGLGGAPTFQFLVDRVRECMDAGLLSRANETEVATVIWAHVHGLSSLRLLGHLASIGDEKTFACFYDRSFDRLLAGLTLET